MAGKKKKPLTPAAEQVAAFKTQFECYAALLRWDLDNPQPPGEPPEKYGYLTVGSPRHVHRAERNMFERSLIDRGWDGSRWTWSEPWDGALVRDVLALDAAGFEVVRFYRKRKIDVRTRDDWDRPTVLQALCLAVGEEWVGVSFGKGILSVWWKGGGPWKSYR
jgi:hypothetical protein